MVWKHHNPDGGFSYSVGKSQTNYYGVPISHGCAVSDIHGTCLLTWALVMIVAMVDDTRSEWHVIKP